MPESTIATGDGLRSTADDWPGLSTSVINWMSDQDGTIRPRPGIASHALLQTGYTQSTVVPGFDTGVIGVYVWNNVVDQLPYLIFVLADRSIWARAIGTGTIYALSTANILTKLDGTGGLVIFTEDSQRLIMAGGGQLQKWTGVLGSISSRISVYAAGTNQPPIQATHVINVANYLVSHDTFSPTTANTIRWSNLGDGAHLTWNPINFNTADADPDPVIAVGSILREVFAFGTKTVQIFGVTSDAALPFASSSSLKIGCAASYSIITIDSAFAWLDNQRRFIVSDGRSYEWISKDIFKLIQDMDTVSDCKGFRVRLGFWDLLVWLFPTEKTAFVYDLSRKDWREWRGWGTDDFDGLRMSSYVAYPEQGLHIVGDIDFPNIWNLDVAATIDSGPVLPIVCEKITEPMDYDSAARKRCRCIRFFAKRGMTPVSSAETAALDVAVSDDGKPFRAQARIDLGLAGDYTNYRDYFPGGIHNKRQLRMRYSGDVDVSVSRVVEMWTPHGEESG